MTFKKTEVERFAKDDTLLAGANGEWTFTGPGNGQQMGELS